MKILLDLREKDPWDFRTIRKEYPGISFDVERRHIATGDYTVEGLETEIVIERKSPKDAINTLTQDLRRFDCEFQRMDKMAAFVIVETTLEKALGNVRDYSQLLHGATIRRSLKQGLVLMALKYPAIKWIFTNDRQTAEFTAFGLLYRHWTARHFRG